MDNHRLSDPLDLLDVFLWFVMSMTKANPHQIIPAKIMPNFRTAHQKAS